MPETIISPSNDAELIAALRAQLVLQQGEIRTLSIERDLYRERCKAFERKLFAAKSEARSINQADLFFNEAEVLLPETLTAPTKISAHQRKKTGRKPLDAALPRTVIRHELPEAERVCPHDGAALTEIGVETSEQLDIIPAQVRVLRHERVKYACPCCDQGLRVAPVANKLLPKALLSNDAIAWIVTAKYQDGLPLYRQAALLNRFGGDVHRGTIATTMVKTGLAVTPIINLLRDHLLDADILHGDETRVQVLKEKNRPAQSQSHMWVQMSGTGPPIRLFTYAPSRSAETAQQLYAGAHGALLTDGYAAYTSVAAINGMIHLSCWAHARRYFIEAQEALPKTARTKDQTVTQFITLIGQLYGIEKLATENNANTTERHRLRQAHSVTIIKQIETLLLAHLHNTAPKSTFGKALYFLHGQWSKLIRYVEDGRYAIDNNICENAIRPFVIGRKNWLFADTTDGATASANLYSLIETAKANAIEPYRYLQQLFAQLPLAKTVDDYEALLPWNIKIIHLD